MTSEEAKLFLHARRLAGQDDNDPRMAEALEQTRRDPALLAWYNERQAFDAAICEKLAQVRAPTDLAGKILLEKRVLQGRQTRRAVMALAIAASVVLLLSWAFSIFWPSKTLGTEFAAMRADMTRFLVRFPELDLATEQWPEIVRWLTQKAPLADVKLPGSVQKFPGLGCREVQWRGQRLLLICFVAQGEVVHLFIVPKTELWEASVNPSAQFGLENGWTTASWRKGETVYLMMTKGSVTFLKGLLVGADQI